MALSRQKLAVMHIMKKELALCDEEYRSILMQTAGVESAKSLDELGFRKLMNYLVRDRRYRLSPGGMTLRQKLFIRSLANNLNWTADHLANFITKYYHKGKLEELTRKEAMHLIESLKNVREHRRA